MCQLWSRLALILRIIFSSQFPRTRSIDRSHSLETMIAIRFENEKREKNYHHRKVFAIEWFSVICCCCKRLGVFRLYHVIMKWAHSDVANSYSSINIDVACFPLVTLFKQPVQTGSYQTGPRELRSSIARDSDSYLLTLNSLWIAFSDYLCCFALLLTWVNFPLATNSVYGLTCEKQIIKVDPSNTATFREKRFSFASRLKRGFQVKGGIIAIDTNC